MPQAAIPYIVGGATVLGAASQASSARDAASAQEGAADESVRLQQEAMRQARMATEPFRFGGQQAINPLLQMLGIQQIQVPDQPVFNPLTGSPVDPQSDRRAEIEKRLAELRAMRGQ